MSHSVYVGDRLPSIYLSEVTAEHIHQYALGSGDFASIHTDSEAAQEAGFSRPVAHGMWLMALGGKLVTRAFPNKVQVTSYTVSFVKPALEGDAIEVRGIVENRTEEAISLAVTVVNQREETVLKGKMVVRI